MADLKLADLKWQTKYLKNRGMKLAEL